MELLKILAEQGRLVELVDKVSYVVRLVPSENVSCYILDTS